MPAWAVGLRLNAKQVGVILARVEAARRRREENWERMLREYLQAIMEPCPPGRADLWCRLRAQVGVQTPPHLPVLRKSQKRGRPKASEHEGPECFPQSGRPPTAREVQGGRTLDQFVEVLMRPCPPGLERLWRRLRDQVGIRAPAHKRVYRRPKKSPPRVGE